MPRGKSSKIKPFEKLLVVMASGKPFSVEELESLVGNDIYMYRISTYIYEIKVRAGGVIKTVKDGRSVVSYQLTNVSEIEKYMKRTGLVNTNFVPGQNTLAPSVAKIVLEKKKQPKQPKQPAKPPKKPKKTKKSVNKLTDLSATPVTPVAPVVEEMQVTEVTTTVV